MAEPVHQGNALGNHLACPIGPQIRAHQDIPGVETVLPVGHRVYGHIDLSVSAGADSSLFHLPGKHTIQPALEASEAEGLSTNLQDELLIVAVNASCELFPSIAVRRGEPAPPWRQDFQLRPLQALGAQHVHCSSDDTEAEMLVEAGGDLIVGADFESDPDRVLFTGGLYGILHECAADALATVIGIHHHGCRSGGREWCEGKRPGKERFPTSASPFWQTKPSLSAMVP